MTTHLPRLDLAFVSSPVVDFLVEECVIDADLRATFGELYVAYKKWSRRNDVHCSGACGFGLALRSAVPGCRVVRVSKADTRRWYTGLALKPVAADLAGWRRCAAKLSGGGQ